MEAASEQNGIDPNESIIDPKPITAGPAARRRRTADVQGSTRGFEDLLLPSTLVDALNRCGYTQPSPVQEAAIPLGRAGNDLIVQAKSGTGKTVVFAAVCLDRLKTTVSTPQALILTPTREIAVQIQQVISLVASHLPPPLVNCSVFVGGLSIVDDQKRLRRACHIAVGTPGRVGALLESQALKTEGLRMMVIDEVDALLADSFYEDTTWILEQLPRKKQVMAFSATYTPELLADLEPLVKKPQRVMLTSDTVELLGVHQCYKLITPALPPHAESAPAQHVESATSQRGQQGVHGKNKSVDAFESKVEVLLEVMRSVSFHQVSGKEEHSKGQS